MSPFRSLLRIMLKEHFSFRRFLGTGYKTSKLKTILLTVIILYAMVAFLGSFGYLFYSLGVIFDSFGIIQQMLLYIFSYGTGITIMFVLFRADGYLFHFRDYQIVAPLPIKPIEIVIAKLITMLIMLYTIVFLFTLPAIVMYFYFAGVTWVNVVAMLMAFFFIPMIPTVICALISVFVARLTRALRQNKLFSILMMFLMFLGVMYFSFSFSLTGDANPLLGQEAFLTALGEAYLPMRWFVDAVHYGNLITLLALASTSLLPLILFVILTSRSIIHINSRGSNLATSKKTIVVYRQRSVLKALISKEFKRFISVPIYAMNSGIGILMMVVAATASLFFADDVRAFLEQMGAAGLSSELLIALFIAFCVVTIYTPAVSLSLEGKCFWQIKSLPVKPFTVMLGKILFNIYLVVPAALYSTVILSSTFGIGLLEMIMLTLTLSLFGILVSFLFAIINLYFPKFDFINETEVVKQSLAAMIAIFGGFGLIAFFGLLIVLLMKVIPFSGTLAIAAGLMLLGIFFLQLIVANVSENLFTKMQA